MIDDQIMPPTYLEVDDAWVLGIRRVVTGILGETGLGRPGFLDKFGSAVVAGRHHGVVGVVVPPRGRHRPPHGSSLQTPGAGASQLSS